MKKDAKNAMVVVIPNVRNMAIYTRTGDDGTTSLFGGKRLSKANLQIMAYGEIDELTTTIGILMSHLPDRDEYSFIEEIQRDLYAIMGSLANAPVDLDKQDGRIAQFEKKIDVLTEKLPALNNFILPHGTLASCWAHMARVSCRKCERSIVLFFQSSKAIDEKKSQIIITYINRLSDLFFTYARTFNEGQEVISKKP